MSLPNTRACKGFYDCIVIVSKNLLEVFMLFPLWLKIVVSFVLISFIIILSIILMSMRGVRI